MKKETDQKKTPKKQNLKEDQPQKIPSKAKTNPKALSKPQEALTNIGKHAYSTQVIISAQKEPGQVHFVVQDYGSGFDVQELTSRRSGRVIGLVAMEERLNMAGGSLAIHSRAQEGTRLSFTIPTLSGGERP